MYTTPRVKTLVGSLTRPINAQIPTARQTKVLEQEAALEVLVGVQDRVEFAGVPEVFVFDLLMIGLVNRSEVFSFLFLPRLRFARL